MSGNLIRTLRSVSRFGRVSPIERSVFLSALFGMIIVRAALLFVPVRRLISASVSVGRRWPISGTSGIEMPLAAKRIVQARRFCPFSTCLSEAIAANFVMARLGQESEVRIGVAKSHDKFEAHAWLECPGQFVIGNPSPDGKQYAAMPSLRRFVL